MHVLSHLHLPGPSMPRNGGALNSSQGNMFRAARIKIYNPERLALFRRFLREDPGAKYDLKTAFDVDPERDGELAVKRGFVQPEAFVERSRSEINKIRKLKNRKFQVSGELVGVRVINTDVPRRVRERLMIEAMRESAQFVIGRFGLGDSIVTGIRRAFCYKEVVRLTVDSPWRDNMKEMARRIEERTGGIIIDRAGGRIFLYRGFTDADLARKGLLSPEMFHDVAVDYEVLREANDLQPSSRSSQMKVIRPKVPGIKVKTMSPNQKTPPTDSVVSANSVDDSLEQYDRRKQGSRNLEGLEVEQKKMNAKSDSSTVGVQDEADVQDDEVSLHPEQADADDDAKPRINRRGKTEEEIEMEQFLRLNDWEGPIGEGEDDVDGEELQQLQRILKLAESVEKNQRPARRGRTKKYIKRKPY